jgi:hypothetical protein
LGFLGVTVITRVQTPLFCGQDCKAGDFVLEVTFCRPKRTNWLIVGIRQKLLNNLIKQKYLITAYPKTQNYGTAKPLKKG